MEDVEMDVSPTDYEPRDFTRREKFRRYGKSPLASSQHDGSATRLSEIRSNAALFFEHVKQEVESFDMVHGGTPYRTGISPRRRLRAASLGQSELDFGEELGHRSSGVRSLKYLKQEEDEITDSCLLLYSTLRFKG